MTEVPKMPRYSSFREPKKTLDGIIEERITALNMWDDWKEYHDAVVVEKDKEIERLKDMVRGKFRSLSEVRRIILQKEGKEE